MSFEAYIDPEDILTDFLRVHLTDPRSRAEDTETSTVTATAGQTEITLTPTTGSVSCITSLEVNSTELKKWEDYFWDYQNSKITFFEALSLNDNVEITYKYGTSNWIYSDKPDENLSATSFPRINIFSVSSPGRRLGQYEAPVESSHSLQIDVWSKKGYISEVDGSKYSNEYLIRYYGNRIIKAFDENEKDLFPLLYAYRLISGPRNAPYSSRYQAYHGIVEINVKGLKSGLIEVT